MKNKTYSGFDLNTVGHWWFAVFCFLRVFIDCDVAADQSQMQIWTKTDAIRDITIANSGLTSISLLSKFGLVW